jgi:formylglycine-generating enzyme required for sulfatase activity|tara:strand:- start:1639 stop:2619 length:981 start_codon:yes stop_codon:yes gene_type:complete
LKNKFFMKINRSYVFLFSLVFLGFGPEEKGYIQNIPGTPEVIEMAFIPGGTFSMGSPKSEQGHFGDEGPQHLVEVDPFWMGKFEITWDLYELFISRGIDKKRPATVSGKEVDIDVAAVSGATQPYTEMSFGMGVEGYPAICMTQLAAVKFCEWLSAMTGNFYRLPTEAEWEYACRAGTKTAYSFGDNPSNLDIYAWHEGNSGGAYHKVGQKEPNPWGLYDMHGNVSEWTLDQYVPTVYNTRKRKTVDNPLQTPTKTYPRVVRGGAWSDKPNRLRSAARRPSSKKWKKRDPQIPKSLWWHTDAPFVGFRVVRPLETPSPLDQNKYWN